MRILRPAVAYLCLAVLAAPGHANESVDDCILRSMQGVQSNAAAHMIREACRNKAEEAKQRPVRARWGDPHTGELPIELDDSNQHTLVWKVSNNTAKTVTILTIAYAETRGSQGCANFYPKRHVFKVAMKPGKSGTFVTPVWPKPHGRPCVLATVMRGKDPSMSDDWVTRMVAPMNEADEEALVRDIGQLQPPMTFSEPAPLRSRDFDVDQFLREQNLNKPRK